MSIQCRKILNVYSTNYGISQARTIKNIAIGMTNVMSNGYGYAESYKQIILPKKTYHYVIDKKGLIYQTIDDTLVAWTFNDDIENFYNLRTLSICVMPEWLGGDGAYDNLSEVNKLPENGHDGDYIHLIKKDGDNGEGIYRWQHDKWVYVGSYKEKRPLFSDNWEFTDDSIKSLVALTKFLTTKYHIEIADVLRVYDVYREYNPAPFIYDDGSFDYFKELLSEAELENIKYVNETVSPTKPEEITPPKTIEELVEDIEGKTTLNVNDPTSLVNRTIDVSKKNTNQFSFTISISTFLETTNTLQEDGQTEVRTTGKMFEITETVENVTYTTGLRDTAGELSFTFRNTKNQIDLKEGYFAGFYLDNVPMFYGKIFEIKQSGNDEELLTVTCYDTIKHLTNCGFNYYENKTASQIFKEVCDTLQLPYLIKDTSSYIVSPRNCFNTSYYSQIQQAINETIAMDKKIFIIQNFCGILEFKDILNEENIRQIKFSKDSAIIDWDFQTDIKDSYNIVVAYIEGEKEGQDSDKIVVADHKEAKDESTIKEWGRLTKVFKAENGKYQGSLQQLADQQLKFWNSPRRKLTLKCTGIAGIMAGNIIYIDIYNVVSVGHIQGCVIVDECVHNIENGKHMMELTCEIVQDGTLRAEIDGILAKLQATNMEKMENITNE